jgi:hypothetical protein
MELSAPGEPGSTPAHRLAWLAAFASWIGLIVLALAVLASYSGRAGAASEGSLSTWPAESKLLRARDRAALVVVAHSECPCTRATLRELERLMARSGGRVDGFVLFVGPPESADALEPLSLRAMARDIPGVQIVEDPAEARRFGARTSGQTYLYDATGTLVFNGGLTPSRGHEGASAGTEAVRRFLVGAADAGEASAPRSDVFGCALFDREPDARIDPDLTKVR